MTNLARRTAPGPRPGAVPTKGTYRRGARLPILAAWAVALMIGLAPSVLGQTYYFMTPQYSTYTNSSTDGTYVYTSVTVDGYSTGTCPTQAAYLANECHSTTHTPKLYNTIGSTGGWQSGGSVYWSSYLSTANSQQVAATPGSEYTYSWEAEVICSFIGGPIYQLSGNTTIYVPALSCGSVTRGQSVTCSVSNFASGTAFSGWKFTAGSNSVTTSSTSSSWSGTAVQSGTVSVTATYSGTNDPLSAPLTVNARTGWAFTAVSPVKEPNGGGTGACSTGLPVLGSPPTLTSGDIGKSCLADEWSYGYNEVSGGGPNNGYWYTTSASSTSTKTGLAATYQWERVPDLDNTLSTFYLAQTGTYDQKTDPTGCILGSKLATQTQRHEIGLASSNYIESHWGEYRTALNSSANNFGTIIESRVGPPSESQSSFTSGLDTALSNANSNIISDYKAEPYGVDHDEYDLFWDTSIMPPIITPASNASRAGPALRVRHPKRQARHSCL